MASHVRLRAGDKDELVSTEETRRIVASYVAALQHGDIDTLRASFTPKATWTIRGAIPATGIADRKSVV